MYGADLLNRLRGGEWLHVALDALHKLLNRLRGGELFQKLDFIKSINHLASF